MSAKRELAVLQDENRSLERKLELLREKHWEKEKEWAATITDMQQEITTLHSLVQKGVNAEVFRAVQGNINLLQEEIVKMRDSREDVTRTRDSGRFMRGKKGEPLEDRLPNLNTNKPGDFSAVSQTVAVALKQSNCDIMKHYSSVLEENKALLSELERCHNAAHRLEAQLDEKTVACRELEVELAASNNYTEELKAKQVTQNTECSGVPRGEIDAARREIEELRQQLQRSKNRESEHSAALRVAEEENKKLKTRIMQLEREVDQIHQEDSAALTQLSLDRRECIEELMRQMEKSWAQGVSLPQSPTPQAVKPEEPRRHEEKPPTRTKIRRRVDKERSRSVEPSKSALLEDRSRRASTVRSLDRASAPINEPFESGEAPPTIQEAPIEREVVPEGAHLHVTLTDLWDVRWDGEPLNEEGNLIVKLKSVKEKYRTSVQPYSSIIHFRESFTFYLAQPNQDVISLRVYFQPKGSSKLRHIGDCCFSLATMFKSVPRHRLAPIVTHPGSANATVAGQVEVYLKSDDFGCEYIPSATEIEEEERRFAERVKLYETIAPEKLHTVDVFLATEPVPNYI